MFGQKPLFLKNETLWTSLKKKKKEKKNPETDLPNAGMEGLVIHTV